MKNYKLNFLFASLLMLLFNSKLSAQWTISGDDNGVCPGQQYKYEATPPTQTGCGIGSCTPIFTPTNGTLISQKVEGGKLIGYVVWNNTTELGKLRLNASCGSSCSSLSTSSNGQTIEIAIRSLAGEQPKNMVIVFTNSTSNNDPVTSFSTVIGDTRQLTLSIEKMFIKYTNKQYEASFYQWQIPANWTFVGGQTGTTVNVTPDRCTGGNIRVRGVISACGNPNDPQGNYYSDWFAVPVTRTIPTIQNFAASPAQVECGSSTSVGLSAAAVAGATSYLFLPSKIFL